MNDPDHLHILWTSADPITAEKMVFMYAFNALKNGWWKKVTVIIWGAASDLTGRSPDIQAEVKRVQAGGVAFSACKGCADELGVTGILEGLGVEVIYWGEPLTVLLRERAALLTI